MQGDIKVQKHVSGKKMTLFITAYITGLVLLAGVGYYFAGFTIQDEHHKMVAEQRFRSDVSYVDLPRMNLTLSSLGGHQMGRVRIDISLAVEKKFIGRVVDVEPRISDRIVTYIRKLDFDDLSQPKATVWLRQRLLEEATAASSPLPIVDVVFQQFVIM
jgi:flagellar basal body-associated protein FliL